MRFALRPPLLKKLSPVAWQHIHFHGHFVFSKVNLIDIDEIIQKLILGANPENIEKWEEIEQSKISEVRCAVAKLHLRWRKARRNLLAGAGYKLP